MIQTTIALRKFEADAELTRYIERKLGKLDKYFPRHHQPTGLRVELHRDESADPAKRFHGLARLAVAGPDIVAETSSMNPHTVVDILEAKLKEQIRRYKDKHIPRRFTLKRSPQPLDTEDTE